MTELERARRVFQKNTFATEAAGCVIDAVGLGFARCSMALTPRHRNALGAPMGGAVFTLADFAFGVASNFDRDVFVTTGAESRFLAAAKGDRLTAEAREVRCGRRTCLFEVNVTDEEGTLTAYFTIEGRLTRVRRKK